MDKVPGLTVFTDEGNTDDRHETAKWGEALQTGIGIMKELNQVAREDLGWGGTL
jgi:hypothetical protein